MIEMFHPLKDIRVWRFGLYYFLVFGCFVAFSQWLVPYFVNGYYLPLVTAGILAALFGLPSGVIRALGGWMSDVFGARKIMYWVLGASPVISLVLIVPKMEIYSPGKGVMAKRSGTVEEVSDTSVVVGSTLYPLVSKSNELENADDSVLVLPTKEVWQEPSVEVGQGVERKQLGVTLIYFQDFCSLGDTFGQYLGGR